MGRKPTEFDIDVFDRIWKSFIGGYWGYMLEQVIENDYHIWPWDKAFVFGSITALVSLLLSFMSTYFGEKGTASMTKAYNYKSRE